MAKKPEIVKYNGKKIGEVYCRDSDGGLDGRWGYLVYSCDDGAEGYDKKEFALEELICCHQQYLDELKDELKRITREICRWS